MKVSLHLLPVAVVLFPFSVTLLLSLWQRISNRLRNDLFLAVPSLVLVALAAMYPSVMAGNIRTVELARLLPMLPLTLRVDALSYSIVLLASFVWLIVIIYALDYMATDDSRTRFLTAMIFIYGSFLGMSLAGDMFTLFIFFEVMSVITYLVIVHSGSPEAFSAGNKYLIMCIIGDLSLFFGVVMAYGVAGTVQFTASGFMPESPSNLLIFLSFLIGFGMKAGMFPLHTWLPDAHSSAPSAASAVLSGIMVKAGAFGLLRVIFNVFGAGMVAAQGWNGILSILAGITILLGSAVALTQNDLKRRLAYSSVGQMGYILLGMSLLTREAVLGSVFHIFSHALMKSSLFLTAGTIIKETGERDIRKLGGIGRSMPVTMGTFTLSALAMIGIPPLNGFLSKLNLSMGALSAGKPEYMLILLLSSLMNGFYYFPIIINAFWGGDQKPREVREGTGNMLAAAGILAIGCLCFGLFSPFNLPYRLSEMVTSLLVSGRY